MAEKDISAPVTPTPAAPQPQPDEGYLHSLATVSGLDPEAVIATAKMIRQHPWQVAKDAASAQAGEFVDAAHHLRETAKSALNGVASAITNPEAKATALARLNSPGFINKLQGAEEYATAAVPLIGGGLVKSEEQAGKGNIRGSLGTLTGIVAPMLIGGAETPEGAEAVKPVAEHITETAKTAATSLKEEGKAALEATHPEGSLEAGFAKIPGSKKVRGATPKPQIYSKVDMIKAGADGYLNQAIKTEVPLSDIEGREPIPAMEGGYKKDTPITQPVELAYNDDNGKYTLYSGNHRVRQAEINGQDTIPAFVENHPSIGKPLEPEKFAEVGGKFVGKAPEAPISGKTSVTEHQGTTSWTSNQSPASAIATLEPNSIGFVDPEGNVHLMRNQAHQAEHRDFFGENAMPEMMQNGGVRFGISRANNAYLNIENPNAIPKAISILENLPVDDVLFEHGKTALQGSPKKVIQQIRQTYPEKPVTEYHLDLQKVIDLLGVKVHQDPSQVTDAAHFVTPDGKFVRLPAGLDHDAAILRSKGIKGVGSETAEMGPDPRMKFLNDTKTVRIRPAKDANGTPTLNLHVPVAGVTPEQVNALKQAVGQGLKGQGHLMLETADNPYDIKTEYKDFARPSDVEPMLQKIGAHPEPTSEAKPVSSESPKIAYGNSDEFASAVQNTTGAKLAGKELTVRAERYQKPEQAGEPSIRTGVFYSPEPNSPYSKYYKTGKIGYGGTQRVEGDITFKNPIAARGASGGKVPERAYDAIQGKGAYEKMRTDVLNATRSGWGKPEPEKLSQRVAKVLEQYGADPDNADYIIEHSKTGNTLPYAIQENIVAHAVRAAGHDGIVGYNKIKGQHRLSEVFHITQDTYPEGE